MLLQRLPQRRLHGQARVRRPERRWAVPEELSQAVCAAFGPARRVATEAGRKETATHPVCKRAIRAAAEAEQGLRRRAEAVFLVLPALPAEQGQRCRAAGVLVYRVLRLGSDHPAPPALC